MNTLYEMLSSERRRRVLDVLTDADEPLDRSELARRIIARRRNERVDPPNPAKVDEITLSLGHVHLPKLADGGLIERTEDERYDATPLGCDVERAARAFEATLRGDDGPAAGDSRTPAADSNAVGTNDRDDDRYDP